MSAKPGKAGKPRPQDGVKVLARNRRARHDYDIEETLEAGIALVGSEVKSLRDQRASIAEGHITIRAREAWLVGVQIQEYPWAHERTHLPTRDRKLLLHRREIDQLTGASSEKGLTIVPTRLYWSGPRAKVELALAKGKDLYDKRRSIKERDERREMQRAMSERY